MLNIATVDPGVVGAQLAQHQSGVRRCIWVVGQGDSIPVPLADLHFQTPGDQDLRLSLLCDEAPFHTGRPLDGAASYGTRGGQRAQVGHMAGDGEAARKHRLDRGVPGNGDPQSFEVI